MGKISWADSVRNEQVLHRVKGKRNILHRIKRRNADYVGHILRIICFLKHIIEVNTAGEIEVTGRRGIRRQHLLIYLKERRGYWKRKVAFCGKYYGPAERQPTE
jgi:hypothetical protein